MAWTMQDTEAMQHCGASLNVQNNLLFYTTNYVQNVFSKCVVDTCSVFKLITLKTL